MMPTHYSAAITAEQFLFRETRIAANLYVGGTSIDDAIDTIKQGNLFQYPTERKISKITRACYRRLDALTNAGLASELANAPIEIAKQVNLYAMMCYNGLVRAFMAGLIGEKYRQQDYAYTKKDMNGFFLRLTEQSDEVSGWSEQTITKLKQVLNKCLIETEMLDNVRATTLNPVFIAAELEIGIRENNDLTALAAFNCFK